MASGLLEAQVIYYLDLKLASELGRGEGDGQSCGTEHLTYKIGCYLQVGSVRIELDCGASSWCLRTAWWCGEQNPHIRTGCQNLSWSFRQLVSHS